MPDTTVGSIVVSLRAETGKFLDGMSRAAYAAQQTAKGISRDFASLQRVASQTFGAFGGLNPVISQVSFAISQAARTSADAMKSFGKMGGTIGGIASLGAGATTAIGAISLGSIALAMHAAEGANELYNLSQAVGISTEALSGLSFVAKENGVSAETMVTGLERMSKSAFAAATAPAGTVNAYTRLGVSVRDAAGNMRSTESIFADLADRFERMPDGVSKTALAMQLFGRGGAALIPVLNQGRDGVQKLLETAQRLGIVVSGETAERAHKFEQTLDEISSAAQGAENKLMGALLPALQTVASSFLTVNAQGESLGGRLVVYLAKTTEGLLGIFNTFWHALDQIGITLEFVGGLIIESLKLIADAGLAGIKLATGDWEGAKADAQKGLDGLDGVFQDFYKNSKKTWQENADFINGLEFHPNFAMSKNAFGGLEGGGFTAGEDFAKRTRGNGSSTDLSSAVLRQNSILQTIERERAQMTTEGELANAIRNESASTILATAAAESRKTIDDLVTTAIKEKIKVTDAEKSSLRDIITITAAYKAAYSDNSEIQKFIEKTIEEEKTVRSLAVAFGQGAAAVESAEEASKVAPFRKQADDLGVVIKQLKETGVSADLSKNLQKSIADLVKLGATGEELAPLRAALAAIARGADPLAPLISAYDELRKKLETATAAERALARQEERKNLSSAISQLKIETGLQDESTRAVLAGAGALRQFNIEKQVQVFTRENPLLDSSEIDTYRSKLEGLASTERINSAAEVVARSESYRATAEEISSLELLRQKQVELGATTTQTDLLIYQNKVKYAEEIQRAVFEQQNAEIIGQEAIYRLQTDQVKQWDEMAFAVGGATDKFRALFNEIQLEGQNLSEKVFKIVSKSIDDLSTTLARFIVTGKSGFKALGESISEALLKATIQKGLAEITARIPGLDKVLGKGTKAPLGTAGDPLYVIMAGARSLPLPPPAGAGLAIPSLVRLPAGSSTSTAPLAGPYPREEGSGLALRGAAIAAASANDGQTVGNPLYTTPVDASGNIPDFSSTGKPGANEIPTSPTLPWQLGSSSLDQGPGAPASPGGFSAFIQRLIHPASLNPQPSSSMATPPFFPQTGGSAGPGSISTNSSPGGFVPLLNQFFGSSTSSARNGSNAGAVALQTAGKSLQSAATSLMEAAASLKSSAASGGSGGGGLGDLSGGAGESDLGSLDGNLPMPPGFGSGGDFSSLTSLASPSDSAAGGGGFFSSLSGMFSSMFSGLTTAISSIGGAVSSGAGTLISGIASIFGFLEGGGDVSPGKAYVVGEKRPEIFIPKVAGTILPSTSSLRQAVGKMGSRFGGYREDGGPVTPGMSYLTGEKQPELFVPNVPTSSSSTSSAPHQQPRQTIIQFHIHGVSDVDSFRRSQSQLMANFNGAISEINARK